MKIFTVQELEEEDDEGLFFHMIFMGSFFISIADFLPHKI